MEIIIQIQFNSINNELFQFRDFLLLYNKLTEMCFKHCADNFYNRQLSTEESTCLDRCVIKFSSVNQRVMATYVEDQTAINARRLKEMEAQVQTARDAELAATTAAATAAAANAITIDNTTAPVIPEISTETSSISA